MERNPMTENRIDLPSMGLIKDYIAAIHERNDAAMQTLRAHNFVLDWVHGDMFADEPVPNETASQFWSTWFAAFPEMDFEVTRTIAAENVVVTQWTFTGTFAGRLGLPVFDPPREPTGKTIRLRGISVFDIQAGLIQKETMYIDLATLYVELGVTW